MEFPKLIGCWWCHSGGRRGSQRRRLPLSDGDWSRLSSPGIGARRGQSRRAPWTEGWGGGGNREAGGGSQLPCPPRAFRGGPGGKKERRTPKLITRGREWQLSRVGRGTSGAGGGVGGGQLAWRRCGGGDARSRHQAPGLCSRHRLCRGPGSRLWGQRWAGSGAGPGRGRAESFEARGPRSARAPLCDKAAS